MKKEIKLQKENTKIKSKEPEKELKNEKEYLEGREHITSNTKSRKNLNQLNDAQSKNLTKEISENQEQTDFENQQEEPQKKMIEIKPRENYLKEKIDKLNFNNDVLSGINKGIDEQLKSVKKDIYSKKVELNGSPKSVDKYVNKSFDIGSNIKNDSFNIKNKYKTIKDLKMEKDNLNKKLMQIVENENLLNTKKTDTGLVVEQNLKEKLKKDLTSQKNKIIQQLENINEKMKSIISNEENINSKKITNLKYFLDNFERDKEIVEIRAKKYLKEKKERNRRIANDLNQLAEKRKKEIENQDKKEKENQAKMANKLKRQAKEIENKHSKEVGAQSLLYKPYINGKIEGSVKKYLFMQKYEKFLKNEQKLIEKENLYRKNKMKHISNEEIEEFNNKMDKKREEKKIITDKKTEKLLEEWNERKKAIPTYVSPLSEIAYNDITKSVNEEKNKKEKMKELKEKKKDFSEEIKYLKPPHKSQELEQKRIETINNLDPKRFLLDKETMKHHQRKGRIILKKPDPDKPSKFSWKLKLLNNSENDISIEKILIKKPKQYKFAMSMEKTPKKLPSIKIDYLQEIIQKKEDKKNKENSENKDNKDDNGEKNSKVKSSNALLTEENYVQASEKKWEKLLNNKGTGKTGNKPSLIDNINNARNRLQLLELQAIQSEKLLKAQEPTSNDVELNKKVSNLLIDSIEAKLSLLNKMK